MGCCSLLTKPSLFGLKYQLVRFEWLHRFSALKRLLFFHLSGVPGGRWKEDCPIQRGETALLCPLCSAAGQLTIQSRQSSPGQRASQATPGPQLGRSHRGLLEEWSF